MQQVYPKRGFLPTKLHGITSHKTVTFTFLPTKLHGITSHKTVTFTFLPTKLHGITSHKTVTFTFLPTKLHGITSHKTVTFMFFVISSINIRKRKQFHLIHIHIKVRLTSQGSKHLCSSFSINKLKWNWVFCK
jgi:hypothetical protein